MIRNAGYPNCQRRQAKVEALKARLEDAQANIAALEAELRRGQRQAAPFARDGPKTDSRPLVDKRTLNRDFSQHGNVKGHTAESRSQTNMPRITIELTSEPYFFLKEKTPELQKQKASIVSIIRDLIEKDRRAWVRGKR